MSSSSSSVSSSSSPRGFQAARERLNLQKQHDREGNGGMDVFLKRTDAGRYLSSLFFEKDDNTKWILNVAGVLFLCVMCVFVLAGFEHVFRGGGGGVVVEAKPPVLSEREEEKEEEVKEEEENDDENTFSGKHTKHDRGRVARPGAFGKNERRFEQREEQRVARGAVIGGAKTVGSEISRFGFEERIERDDENDERYEEGEFGV